MIAAVSHDVLSEEKSYSILSKVECIFAAIWHNPEGLIRTEDVAKYYEVSPDEVSDILKSHWDEFGEETKAGWTPRAAIRLGMILNSATATKVRSLALDVIEAHNAPSKKASVEFLLKNADFVEWSNREIGRILECSHKVVGEIRKKLEAENKVIPIARRKCNRGGKTFEQSNKTTQPENQGSSPHLGTSPQMHPSNPDSTVAPPQPKVKVSSQSHPRFGQEGIVTGDPDNKTHLFVSFPDSPSELVAIADLDSESVEYPSEEEGRGKREEGSPSSLLPSSSFLLTPRTYTEEELNRAIAEAKLGFKVEMEELALAQVKEQLIASRNIVEKVKAENIKLQQQLEQMESLRVLEIENKHLQERNQELEKALAEKPMQQWDVSNAVVERLNKNVQAMIKNTIDLRSLAIEPPKQDAEECLRLMGMALGNLARALNNPLAMAAAATILKCEPNPTAIASSIERSQLSDQAVIDIRTILVPQCTWEEFWKVASEYVEIKDDYWLKLTPDERKFIVNLKKDFDARVEPEFPELSPIQVGAEVSHSDKYSTLYVKKGRVCEELNDEEVSVVWDEDGEQRPKRYFRTDLRLAALENAKV
jgi:hypothetical protein